MTPPALLPSVYWLPAAGFAYGAVIGFRAWSSPLRETVLLLAAVLLGARGAAGLPAPSRPPALALCAGVAGVALGLAVARRARVVGLTGGLASGKSLAAAAIARAGGVVVDLDKIAREVVEPGRPAWRAIVATFGEGVLLPPAGAAAGGAAAGAGAAPPGAAGAGAAASSPPAPAPDPARAASHAAAGPPSSPPLWPLDRAALRARIAADPAARKAVNHATHPAILVEAFRQVAWHAWLRGARVCVDAPLLFETGPALRLLCHPVIVVAAPPGVQLARARARDGDAAPAARAAAGLIAAQMPLMERAARPGVVLLDNGAGVDEGEARARAAAAWAAATAWGGGAPRAAGARAAGAASEGAAREGVTVGRDAVLAAARDVLARGQPTQ